MIPKSLDIKKKKLTECHAVLYSVHPGVQRTLNEIRQSFYWKGQTVDFRTFVDSCKIFQTEKSGHSLSKGQLQIPALPIQRWNKVSVDYVTYLPDVEGMNSVMTAIDKPTRMTHVIACCKSVTAAQSA